METVFVWWQAVGDTGCTPMGDNTLLWHAEEFCSTHGVEYDFEDQGHSIVVWPKGSDRSGESCGVFSVGWIEKGIWSWMPE